MSKRKGAMKPLTVPELFAAMHKSVENAKDLVRDADLLLAHERYPRAFALAEFASEELTKPNTYLWAASKIVYGKPVDWDELDHVLRHHVIKIENSLFKDYMLAPHATIGQGVEGLVRKLLDSKQIDELKNYSLYSSFLDGQPSKPSEIIDAMQATKWVRRAKKQLGSVESFVVVIFQVAGTSGEHLHQMLQDLKKDAQLQSLASLEDRLGDVKLPLTAQSLREFLTEAEADTV